MNTSSPTHTNLTPTIAIVGGTDYVEAELEAFLYGLHEKYPESTVVTGDGRGAEKATKTLLEAIGHKLVVPPVREDLYVNPLGCQINDILIPATVIVLVGNPDGSRPKWARDIWNRIDSWREPELRRKLVNVAVPKKKAKAAPKRKAKKKAHQLAV